ncbi:hypothetical protein [Pedobacter sp.]
MKCQIFLLVGGWKERGKHPLTDASKKTIFVHHWADRIEDS